MNNQNLIIFNNLTFCNYLMPFKNDIKIYKININILNIL